MKYLLDTNAWIMYLRQSNPALIRRLSEAGPAEIVLCSIVLAELRFGAERSASGNRAANLALVSKIRQQFLSLPFDDAAAEECGIIRAHLASRGQLIGPHDLMIAAIAKVHQLTLVTHNIREFSRVPDLLLEDWQSP